MKYKGYKIEHDGEEYFIYKRGDLVGGADTEKQAKALINKMIKQNVNHESEVKW